ncbi:hypothetical protein HYG86_09345 [Alkalicella caledoniensis]|uniref:Uncharacterized protein n=1 Tax=Alkalicella caledoniensis TaxID=2731377 RepID=A0A7G9W8F4_ALKCA|nr:hypothetical protein [Alkalicella caledoniensis]QNO14966.1 hypothetical protein HYG86_09345 [Alkalicella caledoniensis]
MLDKISVKILKLLQSKGSLPLDEIEEYISSRYAITDNIELLEKNGYILNLKGDEPLVLYKGRPTKFRLTVDVYKLLPPGVAYLEYISKDKFRFWVPIVISVIALTVSLITLYKP